MVRSLLCFDFLYVFEDFDSCNLLPARGPRAGSKSGLQVIFSVVTAPD
jgi:hypothetical protein